MAGIGEGLEDHPTLLLPYTITAKISATPGKIASSEVWAEYQASKTGMFWIEINWKLIVRSRSKPGKHLCPPYATVL